MNSRVLLYFILGFCIYSLASAYFTPPSFTKLKFSPRTISTATYQNLKLPRNVLLPILAQPKATSSTGTTTLLEKEELKQEETVPNYKEEIEKNWRLVLHDDEIHTVEEVCDLIIQLCPLCPSRRAYDVTMQVHASGIATICSASKKLIEQYLKALGAAGLTVSMAPEEEFESSEDEDAYSDDGGEEDS